MTERPQRPRHGDIVEELAGRIMALSLDQSRRLVERLSDLGFGTFPPDIGDREPRQPFSPTLSGGAEAELD